MSKLLRVLEKAGLVETSGQPVPMPAPDEPTSDAAIDTVDATADTRSVAPLDSVIEQRRFEDIYADYAIPAAAFSADKLLRVLDGLGALDPVSRKAAVLALDAADDNWSIDDVLLDAERKQRALDSARQQLEQHARNALQRARDAVQARDQAQDEAVTRIRQQIGELEALLEREVARATQEKATLENDARATKEACLRETARYDAEVSRLGRIAEIFGPDAGTPAR